MRSIACIGIWLCTGCIVWTGSVASAEAAQPPAQAADRRHLTPDDLYRPIDVSDPRVSPDGQWVAYVATSNDRNADTAPAAIWMTSWDGTQRLALSAGSESTSKPRWSPDGRYLAFLSHPPGSDKTQVMLLDRRGGEARVITHETGEITDYAWAPDGKRLAFVMEQGGDATPKPIVIDALHFKEDGDGYLSAARLRHLFLLDVETGRTEPLTDPKFNDEVPVWSPDGKYIVFERTRERGPDPDAREDIDIVEARGGAAPRTLVRPYAPNSQKLAFSPDGAQVAFFQGLDLKNNAYMQDRLFVVPASGGAPRALTDKLDRAVTSYAFSADSASIEILVEDDLTAYPARVTLKDDSIERETPPAPLVLSNISSAGGHTAVLQSTDATLPEVYALENGKLRKLTGHNDAFLAELELGAVDELRFKGKDGTDIHGLMVKPPGFTAGRRYPTLLWIHGGPNGQDEHSLALDGYLYAPQMFAAKGYVVLRINYRGGSGRGLAYAKTIAADWGHKEVIDLLAGVDHAIKIGVADPERLAIGGWSYGGILTDYTIASDPRFKAAIAGAGSANQISMYGADEYVLQYNNELGPPWRDTALWLKVSYPFFHADRIHTPTLFLSGLKDFNVPTIGGEQMYQSLRTLGVPTQLVVYPGEHHVFSRPSFIKDLADRTTAWLDRFIPNTAPR
ncbi:MAG TPA: S9 family peptidase [Steroidobacteraceae bacterium]|nr:S9 family peptidase [Steroidobacteraceae bacterium]